jgi:hypothetical protein
MKPWQFEFRFVPSNAAQRPWAFGRPAREPVESDVMRPWDDVAFIDSLSGNTPRTRWRDPYGHFVDVLFEEGRLAKVSATLDLRDPCLKFVSDLTLVANRLEWLVLSAEGQMFRPTVRRFLVEIQRSPAMRWIREAGYQAARRRESLLPTPVRANALTGG